MGRQSLCLLSCLLMTTLALALANNGPTESSAGGEPVDWEDLVVEELALDGAGSKGSDACQSSQGQATCEQAGCAWHQGYGCWSTPPPTTPCPNPAASDPLACCGGVYSGQVCRYRAHQQNTTALSWMAAHFKRTREGSCADHTCWHALICENSGAPSTPCDFSNPSYSTSYCLPAAGFQNAKCKSLMLINCPCDGTTDIDAYFDSVMADYATRYKTEWLNRHSDAATRSAIAASNEAYLVNRSAVDLSSIAKETLGTCAERNCNNRLAASISAASGGSSKDLDVDLEEASLVDVLFGGGAMC